MNERKVGCWIIGAKGGVSTTLLVGIQAIKRKLSTQTGLVSNNKPFNELNLVSLDNIVWGGYEIRQQSLYESAVEIEERTGTLGYHVLTAVKPDLDELDNEIKDGITINCGRTIEELADHELQKNQLELGKIVESIQNDLTDFVKRHELDNLVVLNLASTEAYRSRLLTVPAAESLDELRKVIRENQRTEVAASTLYAYSAMELGYGYVNFTPSIGSDLPSMNQLAMEKNVPHMGKDGKTGETLMKSVLAPMFTARNMQVLSWAGFNILGDRDGQVLDDPENKETKIKSKDQTILTTLGDETYTKTLIEYVPSLDDWKTAWDHIHFKGFLDTKMVLQFIWQGCDSILAAPLAIDMVRFADFAAQKGEAGLMPQLACLYKSPQGVSEFGFSKQYQMLIDYAENHLKNS